MKIRNAIILATGLMLIGAPAAAKHPDDSADYLCKTCADNTQDEIFCLGYIRGIINAMDGEAESGVVAPLYCIPPSTSLNDIKFIWSKYCGNQPKDRQARASSVLTVALARAFPCLREENQAPPPPVPPAAPPQRPLIP